MANANSGCFESAYRVYKTSLLRLRIRGIDRDEVKRILLTPREIYHDVLTGNFVAIGRRIRRESHWLIVVYTRYNDGYYVITVIDTKSLDRIIQRRISSGKWVRVW